MEANDEDELNRLIGRIVRTDVHLEQMLREVFDTIVVHGTPATALMPNDVSGLLQACRAMLERLPTLGADEKAWAAGALHAADAAHAKRNRATHDQLLPKRKGLAHVGGWTARRYKRGQYSPIETRDVALDDLRSTLQELRIASFRIHQLGWAIADMELTGEEWRYVRGEFTIEANGAIKLSSTPED